MGYRDDAFYNLHDRNDGSSGAYNGADRSDNAKFMFPPSNIRFLAAQSLLDSKKASGGTADHPTFGTPNDYKIQRGYLRGLNQPGINNSDFKPLKCSFQFNPQTIQQSVSMREDVYLPIMQDPIQFAQPFGGAVNFGFDLLFDRSMELAQGASLDAKGYAAANRDSINYKEDVRDIGAMADLQVLYAIIGQGFSKELLDFQASRLRQAAQFKNNADVKGGGEGITVSDGDIGNFINDANVGNSAFLIPNPVRVIFSSLFMIDGFVTGTTVDYLKFSTNMVPMQVRVSISMNAIYIGFAREKTFLTEQLEKAGEELKAAQEEEMAEFVEVSKAVKDIIKSYRFATGNFDLKTFTSTHMTADDPVTPIYQFAFEDGSGPDDDWSRQIRFDFPWPVKTILAGRGGTIGNDPSINTFLETNLLTMTSKLKLWGPFDTQEEANKASTSRGSGYDNKICGYYEWTTDTSTGELNDDDLGQLGHFIDQNPHNQAPKKLKHNSNKTGDSNGNSYSTLASKFYFGAFTLKVTAKGKTSADASSISTSATAYLVEGGSGWLGARVPLSWTVQTPGNSR